jgi:hypothetical protein
MEKHPDWKPLSDEWFLSIVQQGGRTEELIQRLVRVGWFGSDFDARAIDRGRAHELRRRIKKFRDDRGMPLFFHIEEEIAGKLEHHYLCRETIRFDEDKLAQIRLAYYQDARYKAKVGNDVTLQINQTFARQLLLFAEWNAAQDRHDHELNGDADD